MLYPYQRAGFTIMVESCMALKLGNGGQPAKEQAWKLMNDFFFETKCGIDFDSFDEYAPKWREVFTWVALSTNAASRKAQVMALMGDTPLQPAPPKPKKHPWINRTVVLKPEHFQLERGDYKEMGVKAKFFYGKCVIVEIGLQVDSEPSEGDYVVFEKRGIRFPDVPINFYSLPKELEGLI